MRAWETVELEENFGQSLMIIKKLLKCLELVDAPDMPEINVANGFLDEHNAYLPVPSSYDISELDGVSEEKLGF